MRWNNTCRWLSLIGLVISILYFCTLGIKSSFIASGSVISSEEFPQLNDELDLSPVFETNERLFTIDDDRMKQTNKIVFNNFVLEYNNYPETLINSMIGQNMFFDKSGTQQAKRYIPEIVRQYNSTAVDLCETHRTTIEPQAAKAGGRWLVVINQENFQQAIPVEQCANPNDIQSNLKTSLLEQSDKLMCRQTKSVIDLYVIVNQKPFPLSFEYPSACEPISI